MKLRNGRKGDFYGCSKYPNCDGTRDIEDDIDFTDAQQQLPWDEVPPEQTKET